MNLLNRDPFLQAYPFDIAMGLIIGGSVTMIFSQDIVVSLVGDVALLAGIFWTVGIALSFNGGIHCRRV